jgi:phage/plasmid-like protein (TIGR03299 family)
MAHNLTTRKDGKVEFAFAGGEEGRKEIWHSLGQAMSDDMTLDQWKTGAGMEWEVFSSNVMFQAGMETKVMSDKKVLFRSDTQDSLAVVGSEYKIVQPSQVIEFFDDLATLHGFKLSAAGTIFGGRRFWATADIGKEFETVAGDKITGYLLLATSVDGTLATTAKFCQERVVCKNTMTVALGENSSNVIKTSHRSVWDAAQVKMDLGLVDASWSKFADNMKKLATTKMSDMEANAYFVNALYDKSKTAEDQTWGTVKTVASLMSLFKGGMGAEYAPNTAYNVLQAVTEYADHYGVRKVDAGRKFMDNAFGKGDSFKTKTYEDMLALAA